MLQNEFLRDLLSTRHIWSAAAAVGSFLAGIFLKQPISQWAKNRGKTKEIRQDIYEAIAEVENSTMWFTRRRDAGSEKDEKKRTETVEMALERFWEGITSHNYDDLLKRARERRRLLGMDADGFERMMRLYRSLPAMEKLSMVEQLKSAERFVEDVRRVISIYPFNKESLDMAREKVKNKLIEPKIEVWDLKDYFKREIKRLTEEQEKLRLTSQSNESSAAPSPAPPNPEVK